MIVEKKVWPKYFQKIVDGKKKYKLRLADFKINEGDTLILKEQDPESKDYTGRRIEKAVTSIIKTKDTSFWSKEEIEKHGLQIISFE